MLQPMLLPTTLFQLLMATSARYLLVQVETELSFEKAGGALSVSQSQDKLPL